MFVKDSRVLDVKEYAPLLCAVLQPFWPHSHYSRDYLLPCVPPPPPPPPTHTHTHTYTHRISTIVGVVKFLTFNIPMCWSRHIQWNWEVVFNVVRLPSNYTQRRLETASITKFFKRLLVFFKPSSRLFASTALASDVADMLHAVFVSLLKGLFETDEGVKIIQWSEILTEMGEIFAQVCNRSSNSLLSQKALKTSACRSYVRVLGVLLAFSFGTKEAVLQDSGTPPLEHIVRLLHPHFLYCEVWLHFTCMPPWKYRKHI